MEKRTSRWHPNLDGLGLAKPLTDGVRTAFDLIYQLRDLIQDNSNAAILAGTHAQRLSNFNPAKYPIGSLFTETDRHVVYQVQTVNQAPAWVYISGMDLGTLANLPSGLGANDAGFLYAATDFLHEYRWTGTVWTFAPGDTSNYLAPSSGASAPQGGLWGLCDGSTYSVAKSDGTTVNVITPNLTSDVFLQGGTYTGAVKAATRATWEAGARTDTTSLANLNESSHTHVVPDQNTADESAHTHPTGLSATTLNFQGGLSSAVVLTGGDDPTGPGSPHHHDVPSQPTGSGSAHTHAISPNPHSHNLTNANAQLTVPSEANGGLPSRIDLQWYIRR